MRSLALTPDPDAFIVHAIKVALDMQTQTVPWSSDPDGFEKYCIKLARETWPRSSYVHGPVCCCWSCTERTV